MRYNTVIQYNRKVCDGAVEINEKEIIIYKKSAAVRYAFGAIGTAIAQGKAIFSFPLKEIKTYTIVERAFAEDLCISLFSGVSVTVGLKQDLKEAILPVLKKAVAENNIQEMTKSDLYSKDQAKDKADQEEYQYQCYYCKELFQISYEVCPNCHCGKTIERIEPKKFEPKEEASKRPDNNLTCRKCGSSLLEGSFFCRKCGTPVVRIDSVNAQYEANKDSAESDRDESLEPIISIDLQSQQISPKIKRAFLFIEDEEWEKADKYLEAVLDEDPINAYAYVGKLMIDFRISNTADLQKHGKELSSNKNFQKARRFSDEDLSSKLNALIKQE